MVRSRISGTGSFVPKMVVTNNDLDRMFDTSDGWISSRTGIRERRVSVSETTAVMAAKAARNALKSAKVSPKEIDLVIVGTVTPEMTFPSTACLVQSELGIRSGSAAFDVSAACSGFLYAIDAADKYIRAGSAKKALVIGVDRFSRIIDWNDRSTCVLFGDGAGAVVLTAEEGHRGILLSDIHSDGRHWDMLFAPGSIQPCHFEEKAFNDYYVKMNGNETFKLAVRTMGKAITDAVGGAGLTTRDIALLIPHQANIRIINATQERLKLPPERVFTNIEKYGNTSAGSIPLALDEAVRAGRVKDDDIVVLVSFGGGLTWGAAVIRW